MKHVRISYTIKEDVNLDEVRAKVRSFVGNMKEFAEGLSYTSYHLGDRSFMHIGYFPDEEALKGLQSQSFFGEFAAFLRERCEEGPAALPLTVVASTCLQA